MNRLLLLAFSLAVTFAVILSGIKVVNTFYKVTQREWEAVRRVGDWTGSADKSAVAGACCHMGSLGLANPLQ